MGHYDDQYETQRIIDEQNHRKQLLQSIKDNIAELNNDELAMVEDVSSFASQYLPFFEVIGRIARNHK